MTLQVKRNFHLGVLWLFLTSTAPFIFFRWPGHPYKILTFSMVLVMIGFLSLRRDLLTFDKRILFLILSQVFFYAFMSIYHRDNDILNLIFQLVTLIIVVAYIKLYIGLEIFSSVFIKFMLVTGLFGVIAFIVHVVYGLSPIFSVQYGGDISVFLGLTTSNVFVDGGAVRYLRYAGFFDEPGTFALFSLMAILMNKVGDKSTKNEIFLILFTLFTMSLAFYFSITLYLILTYFSFKRILSLVVISLILFFALNEFKEVSDLGIKIYSMTFERLLMLREGFSSTNRSDLLVRDFAVFKENPLLGIGTESNRLGGANFWAIFARYGIIGSLFYYIHILYLVYVAIHSRRMVNLIIVIIIFSMLFYRPELSSVLTLLCIFTLMNSMKSSYNNKVYG